MTVIRWIISVSFITFVAECSQRSPIKALLCVDPDVGTLHAVNTTWPSTTFCGNYTCKVRRKQTTDTPLTVISFKGVANKDKQTNDDVLNFTIEKHAQPVVNSPLLSVLHKEIAKNAKENNVKELKVDLSTTNDTTNNTLNNSEKEHEQPRKNDNNENSDGYLTGEEIKSISEILHTVKKSDLEALIEIYSLAQHIYKEMNLSNTDIESNAINLDDDKTQRNEAKNALKKSHKKSYWYESQTEADLTNEGSDIVTSSIKPYIDPVILGTETANYRWPNYYPLSNLQRISTYEKDLVSKTVKPCNVNRVQEPMGKVSQERSKLLQPSSLLPYPFAYVHRFNTSEYPRPVYVSPWTQIHMYNRDKSFSPYYKGTYFAQQPGNAILVYPSLVNEAKTSQQLPQRPIETTNNAAILNEITNKMPDWQTEELPSSVINEVRANMENSRLLKPFPLRKKINLERVDNLIKIDEVVRAKREIDNESAESTTDGEIHETYIEKIMCHMSDSVGFFQYGNMSRPFPGCCPLKINT